MECSSREQLPGGPGMPQGTRRACSLQEAATEQRTLPTVTGPGGGGPLEQEREPENKQQRSLRGAREGPEAGTPARSLRAAQAGGPAGEGAG